MPTDKEVKKEFKLKASKTPEKFYAVDVLKQHGFSRRQCPTCQTFFWSINGSTCGDPSCSGGFRFLGKRVTNKEHDYLSLWKEFSTMFKKKGYTPIKRYPTAARWRTDTDFVQASIYDFQPFVVSGEVQPPANPLVVPQLCMRFNDIDNVGYTSAHFTSFIMIGQHAFMPPEQWNQAKYFEDIHDWLSKGLGLKNEHITYHEDAWAGGGNFGPSMEFFSHGLELGNQVYMQYQQTPAGPKELKLKVLDMGMGYERNVWFSKGAATSYEAAFPTVCKKMYELTGIKPRQDVIAKFLPFASYLNVDEVDDIQKVWSTIAKNINMDVQELQKEIIPLASLYSVAEHARTLLIALADGTLPSNVGGGYNLRTLFRRAQSFIDQYGWKVSMPELAAWHAVYLKPLFPELSEYHEEVKNILDVEKQKFNNTKEKTAGIVARLKFDDVDQNKLLELYDSQGIAPELIKEEFAKQKKKLAIPDNFYALVAARHEKQVQEHQTKQEEEFDFSGISETEALYYDDWKAGDFSAKVVKVMDKQVVLDKTLFYPTSGGQLHDLGTLNDTLVINVVKHKNHIVHVLDRSVVWKVGQVVQGSINKDRRKQLAQHHTSTHMVNAAARLVLGKHVNQAGAKKTEEKAHIDLTHYQSLSEEEFLKIESTANMIIRKAVPVEKSFMDRTDAEQKYGFTIYQGGVPPGKKLRIINIVGYDVEACGGTHLDNTSEAETIKLLKASKIQDGIVRIEFTAGAAALRELYKESKIVEEAAKLLQCTKEQVPGRCQELFTLWKNRKKDAIERIRLHQAVDNLPNTDGKRTSEKVLGKEVKSIQLKSQEKLKLSDKELLEKASVILKTQQEHVVKTVERFLKDLDF
ncbi:MAG: alanine--tRNA ligase [Nanoarchaeota archaeon]|nr:alanine--tRNA ligase [Nanoarchaeota archaeon]